MLRLQDDAERHGRLRPFDELRARFRDKYPDAAYERTLHYVRDREAEERRERALDGLMNIIVEKVVDDLIAEESRVEAGPADAEERTLGH